MLTVMPLLRIIGTKRMPFAAVRFIVVCAMASAMWSAGGVPARKSLDTVAVLIFDLAGRLRVPWGATGADDAVEQHHDRSQRWEDAP